MLPFHGNMQYFMHTTSQPISLAYHAACLEFYISFGIILSERLAYNKPMYVTYQQRYKLEDEVDDATRYHTCNNSIFLHTHTHNLHMWARCCPLLFINNNYLLTDNRPAYTYMLLRSTMFTHIVNSRLNE